MPVLSIENFNGKYRFLSNFYPCLVVHDGIGYPSAEHAFQASKSESFLHREHISNLLQAKDAKKFGRSIPLRSDWEDIKDLVMFQVVLTKFATNEKIRNLLIATGGAKLVEGNTWGDCYWGVCDGVGENMLGQILMDVRKLLR